MEQLYFDMQCKFNDCECTGLPDNAQWNTASSITQTWNGSTWTPTTAGTYNTAASTAECRFKCKNGYGWNGGECTVDNGDSTNDSDYEPDGDTGEPEPDGDSGDTTPPTPTPAQICAENGGNYSGGACSKVVPCGVLPENDTEWNDSDTATLTFDFESGEWPAVPSPNYNEAGGVCTYKCEAGTRREDNACKNLCSVKLNGTNSYIFLDNDPRSLFDTDMGSEWTIEFWYKQDSLPTFSQSTSTPPVLRRGGNGVSSPSFEIYPVGTYTRYGGTRRYLYTTVTTNMTYSVMGFGRTEEYTATYDKQVSTLPSYTWVHVALTGKSTVSGSFVQSADVTLNLYVNGVKVATKEEDNISSSEALKLASVNDGLYVGYNGSRYFKGLVSGLRISKAVLYNGSFTPSADLAADTNTLESWKFDHEMIMKLVGSAGVPESDLHNIEWSTDCPGTDTGNTSTSDEDDANPDEEPSTDEDVEPAAPIVVNGGFEEVDENGIPSNWHTANSTGEYPFSSILTANISSVTDAAYVKSGTKAVKLVSSKSGNERFVADAIALAAGNYKCSVFAKGDTNVKIGFCKGNASSCSFNATTHTTLSDEWLEIVHEFTLAADEPTINFVIAVNSKANSTTKEGYFDDFVCSPLENYDPIFSDNNPI